MGGKREELGGLVIHRNESEMEELVTLKFRRLHMPYFMFYIPYLWCTRSHRTSGELIRHALAAVPAGMFVAVFVGAFVVALAVTWRFAQVRARA